MILPGDILPLRISISPSGGPGDDSPERDVLLVEIDNPAGLGEERLRNSLIEMTGLTEGYVLRETRTTQEWGASATIYQITLAVAEHAWSGIVGGAAWAVIDRLVRQRRGKSPTIQAPTDEEAERYARFRIALRYEVDTDRLQIVEATRGTGREGWASVIIMDSPEGERYVVSTTATEEGSITRIERPQ